MKKIVCSKLAVTLLLNILTVPYLYCGHKKKYSKNSGYSNHLRNKKSLKSHKFVYKKTTKNKRKHKRNIEKQIKSNKKQRKKKIPYTCKTSRKDLNSDSSTLFYWAKKNKFTLPLFLLFFILIRLRYCQTTVPIIPFCQPGFFPGKVSNNVFSSEQLFPGQVVECWCVGLNPEYLQCDLEFITDENAPITSGGYFRTEVSYFNLKISVVGRCWLSPIDGGNSLVKIGCNDPYSIVTLYGPNGEKYDPKCPPPRDETIHTSIQNIRRDPATEKNATTIAFINPKCSDKKTSSTTVKWLLFGGGVALGVCGVSSAICALCCVKKYLRKKKNKNNSEKLFSNEVAEVIETYTKN